jgi:putative transposase
MVYHVLNRANSRRKLFFTDKDYLAFLNVLIEAHRRWPRVQFLSVCIMPNHWHLVLRPSRDGELSLFMRWLSQTHTQRWRHARRTVGYGALYQGRFKSFLVQEDEHFLVVCRYVEQNPLRARLVDRAENWRWSSAWIRRCQDPSLRELLSEWPVARPRNWPALLNQPQKPEEKSAVKTSIDRSRPLGGEEWTARQVKRLGLTHTIRPPGRPRKESES